MTPTEALQDRQSEWGASRHNEYARCNYAHRLRYVEKVEPVAAAGYFMIGTLVHACLSYVADAARVNEQADWQDVLREAEALFPEFVLEEAARLLEPYFKYWGEDNAGYGGYDIVAVEQPLGSAVTRYTATADCILQEPSGQFVIVDTKTASRDYQGPREETVRDLRTRPQFLGLSYLLAQELRLEYYPRVLVNLIVKSRVPKFDRLSVEFAAFEVERWRHNQTDTRIDNDSKLMNFSSCAPYGPRCWAFDWCHGTQEQRERLYRPGAK